jgi:DivIVA domain-containing protein
VLAAEVIVAVLVLAGGAAALVGWGDRMSLPGPDLPDDGLPSDRPLRSDDVERLRFRVALRGYRMSDVDRALDRLQAALRGLEQGLAMAEARDRGGRTAPGRGPRSVLRRPPTA